MIQRRLRTEKEASAESQLIAGVKALGGRCYKIRFLGVPGAPDRLILLPGGRFFLAELKKSAGGELEPTQKNLFPVLERLGFTVWLLRGPEAVRQFLNYIERPI